MTERYEYIKATVGSYGDLTIRYRLEGSTVTGNHTHDEDVSDYTENEIRDLVCGLIDVAEDQKDLIEIEF